MPTTFTYINNVPATNNKPSVDQPNMLTNTQSINSIIGVDHLSFGTATGSQSDGYHTIIHLTQNTTPAAISTIGQVWSQQVTFNGTGDEALFFRGGGAAVNRIVQLTTPTGYSLNINPGYTFLPGGTIMQWGYITLPGSSNPHGTVTFGVAFPNQCFNVQLSLNANAFTGSANTAATIGTPSTTTFQWNFTGSTSYNFIYWLAIGN